jgi:hypothetical protein
VNRLPEASWPGRWILLTAFLAAGYVFIGLTSPLAAIRWPALAGGLLVLAALWLATHSHPAALTLLAAGAVLPSVSGWWSLLLPATGILILVCGTQAIRTTTIRSRPQHRSPEAHRPHTLEG